MNMMSVIYSIRSISYVIARTGNTELNVLYVMYSTRSISCDIAKTTFNSLLPVLAMT
jgi:hypothetical protein